MSFKMKNVLKLIAEGLVCCVLAVCLWMFITHLEGNSLSNDILRSLVES